MKLLPVALLSASLALAAPALDARNNNGQDLDSKCQALKKSALSIDKTMDVYAVERYPDNTTFTSTLSSLAYPAPVPNLVAFCRFGAYFNTSTTSRVRFEVWLPENTWNGRFAMVGLGGDAGGVNYPDMGMPMSKYGFATASTDTGHNGTSGDGTFALNGPETQIDFGYRAVHLTAVYSKKIIKQYYGKQACYNYWLGCSSGGKQGLKEAQAYPKDFDGILAGASALWWTNLNAQTYRINALVNTQNTSKYLSRANYNTIGALVLDQCDKLDGVQDGIINNPFRCKPDLSPLSCSKSGANSSTCLKDEQIDTMEKIYNNYTFSDTGEYILSGFEPGSEGLPPFSVNGVPYGPGPDFFEYQVLNKTSVGTFNVTDEAEFEKLIRIAQKTNPGATNANNPYIKNFLKRGKILNYVGLADTLIPTGLTIYYYESVRSALGLSHEDLQKSFRLFPIPGCAHCSGGPGAFNFGGPGQRPLSLNGTGQPLSYDAQHDATTALMQWVEKGIAPDSIVSVKYKNDNKNLGAAFTRRLCPYPQEAIYQGGDNTTASSFKCMYKPW